MSTNLEHTIIVPWDEFPESLLLDYAGDYFMTDVEDNGVVVDVSFDFTPYCPGRYDGHPDNMYPAEQAEVEITDMTFNFYVQRAKTSKWGDRLYSQPQGGYTLASDHIHTFNPRFIDIALSFARDWIDENIAMVEEILLDWASARHKDEVSEILAEVEAGVEEIRRERESSTLSSEFPQRSFIDMVCAQWEAERKSRGDN